MYKTFRECTENLNIWILEEFPFNRNRSGQTETFSPYVVQVTSLTVKWDMIMTDGGINAFWWFTLVTVERSNLQWICNTRSAILEFDQHWKFSRREILPDQVLCPFYFDWSSSLITKHERPKQHKSLLVCTEYLAQRIASCKASSAIFLSNN